MFSQDETFGKYLDAYKRQLRIVQRELGHHAIGRRSVASQANRAGHSMKAIQARTSLAAEHGPIHLLVV
ncbi:MAG TPA: hypothetical protein RMH85_16365 [Polyangiaceae bacterium LLY-WYZ-15_(1-7)]|nr:hypothetical protein [Sandaracinus sp.]HJK91860.1 hypothetical protein [Polyangiaceae bacterium LLY-WYZ-15_(1-7)]HJL01226.1 hypothetical protein [Polyangiaceae bacterium LLY-WYZ-15_(1-7)]HJL10077.1 hypothetical protein [Polyangiaceae bacterium LLY-WYZ-15_(1-7)]HJL22970.1 hypothetical protein [Polyangiaceae bacterium LLY-WYZ-15_(1-7)]